MPFVHVDSFDSLTYSALSKVGTTDASGYDPESQVPQKSIDSTRHLRILRIGSFKSVLNQQKLALYPQELMLCRSSKFFKGINYELNALYVPFIYIFL